MKREVGGTLATGQRVLEFLAQHQFAEGAAALGEQARELAEAVAVLSGDALNQETATRFVEVHVRSCRALAQALRSDHMLPVSRIAREVFGVSGMDRAFRVPPNGGGMRTLLTGAAAMADAARKEKDVFLRGGLAPDFIEQLQKAAAELEAAGAAKTQRLRERVTATASLAVQEKQARRAVRMLDAILTPRLKTDVALLTAWRSVKRVRPTTAAGNTDAAGTEVPKAA
jgi:hypothetical protein